MRAPLAVLATVLAVAACAAPAPSAPPAAGGAPPAGDAASNGERGASTGYPSLPELDAAVEKTLAATTEIPGATIAIAKDGKVAYAKGYGRARLEPDVPMATTTIVNVASISKVVTAAVVMHAVQSGKVGLDDDVAKVLGFPLRNPRFPDVPISLRMLMTHTASIDSRSESFVTALDAGWAEGSDSPLSLATFVQDTFTPGARWYDDAHYHDTAPGTAYDYCNVCPAISAYVVEKVTGKPFETYSQEVLFAPLGLTSTTWRLADTDRSRLAVGYVPNEAGKLEAVPHQGAPYWPATSLRTTAEELAKIVLELASEHAVLTEATAKEMMREQYPFAKGQGLGWESDTPGVWGHSGSDVGHAADVRFDVAAGTAVVVLTNGNDADFASTPYVPIERAMWTSARGL